MSVLMRESVRSVPTREDERSVTREGEKYS